MKVLKFAHPFSYLSLLKLTILAILLCSCIANKSMRSPSSTSSSNLVNGNSSLTPSKGTQGAIPSPTATSSATPVAQLVQLENLIDPVTMTAKNKISIPKNYQGYLYITGINLGSLIGQILQVRMNFGYDQEAMVFPATVARGTGILPQTNSYVLIIDVSQGQFQNMRLPYDLYDYNNYKNGSVADVVTDPTNGGLYCRGLQLKDDPTYIPTSSTVNCVNPTDKCLYAYAKITDAGFYENNGGVPLTTTPTKPQIWSSSTVFNSTLLNGMCLPDIAYNNSSSSAWSLFNANIPADPTISSTPATAMTFHGAYRAITSSSAYTWGISGAAIAAHDATTGQPYGLFDVAGNTSNVGDYTTWSTWSSSLLFPRAGKISLPPNVNYLGSIPTVSTVNGVTINNYFVDRTNTPSVTGVAGTTNYMDGCSMRVMSYNAATNEGIGSCNVLANIQLFYMNGTNEVDVAQTNALKIQLTRAMIVNSSNQQVLANSFNVCSSSTTCGASECCYSGRCWPNQLVSQCIDSINPTGNYDV